MRLRSGACALAAAVLVAAVTPTNDEGRERRDEAVKSMHLLDLPVGVSRKQIEQALVDLNMAQPVCLRRSPWGSGIPGSYSTKLGYSAGRQRRQRLLQVSGGEARGRWLTRRLEKRRVAHSSHALE